jgi:hypothetical protein
MSSVSHSPGHTDRSMIFSTPTAQLLAQHSSLLTAIFDEFIAHTGLRKRTCTSDFLSHSPSMRVCYTLCNPDVTILHSVLVSFFDFLNFLNLFLNFLNFLNSSQPSSFVPQKARHLDLQMSEMVRWSWSCASPMAQTLGLRS